ncbi:hypothetical protein [Massilia sp. ZL223]|uniref:hypothetical protein n=1 Tax=Massilia sp. ZL223 TaxID=2824904 RepID=UPI001B824A27|nr:hypothetical protein [Massilia sp. ZL223]MBQ5964623.1 hypothetical protein [Massilia sp. ZL223]
MIALHRITDANLISARCYGIELDLDGPCEQLASRVRRGSRMAWNAADEQRELFRQERMFRAIILHAWPEPDDPVVLELRAQARLGLAHVDLLTGRRRSWHPPECASG